MNGSRERSARPPIKVVHVISGLGQGGAETMLYKLLGALDRQCFETQVISLLDYGVLGPRIQALGISVFALGMRPGIPDPRGILKLARLLRLLKPDLVQTWMYHADLAGGIAARLAGTPRLVWNIRQSDLDPRRAKRSTRAAVRAAAWLSRWLPDHILCCSERARDIHAALGYRTDRLEVIPNGFDLHAFRPDAHARAMLRAELSVAPSTPLIGLVARFDPQKDHAGFLQAAAALAEQNPQCAFLLCGTGVTWDNPALAGPIRAAGIAGQCHLLGPRGDMPAINAALDIGVCASAYGEGFPNSVGEAMACGVPCVVTDVGDSATIVGDTGHVVPPRDPSALTVALAELLRLDPATRQALGTAAQRRIAQHYALERIAERYTDCYLRLIYP